MAISKQIMSMDMKRSITMQMMKEKTATKTRVGHSDCTTDCGINVFVKIFSDRKFINILSFFSDYRPNFKFHPTSLYPLNIIKIYR